MEKVLIGKISHYYPKINVAVLDLEGHLRLNDRLSIEGKETSFEQNAFSIQIEHQGVESAESGMSVGLKVNERVKEGDKVFKVTE